MSTVPNDSACASVENWTVVCVLRLCDEMEHRIRNLIAAPKVRMSEERRGGFSLVPVPNSIDSTICGAHAFEQNFRASRSRRQRQSHAGLVQDGYVEFVTLEKITSTNVFVRNDRAKLQRMLIEEFSLVDHTFVFGINRTRVHTRRSWRVVTQE
jgi:hypothetical protein